MTGRIPSTKLAIAVCGAGIGGLASALLLARQGHAVTLFEQFETPQPVGSGFMMQPTGMAVLEALGLADAVAERGAWVDRIFGRSEPKGAVVLDVSYSALDPDYRGLGVQRAALFDLLYEAVKREAVTLRPGMIVTGASRGTLTFSDYAPTGPFDLIVDALGTHSALSDRYPARALPYGALWATLDWPADGPFSGHALEQRYHQASKMVGVLPVGSATAGAPEKATFFWSLPHDAREDWRAGSLDGWKDEVRALWPDTAILLDQIDGHDALAWASYRHRTLARPYGDGIVHIGDSYHATSPQLGQGANMALLDAYALAQAVATEGTAEIGATYAQLRQGHVRLFQTMSRLFTPVYQSDSRALPVLRDRIAGPLSKLWPAPPMLASLVTGTMGRPLGRMGLDAYRAGKTKPVARS